MSVLKEWLYHNLGTKLLAAYHVGLGSILEQFVWDMWLVTWTWDMFL
jgi:hypothetical protein